jgi:hypothetical protein
MLFIRIIELSTTLSNLLSGRAIGVLYVGLRVDRAVNPHKGRLTGYSTDEYPDASRGNQTFYTTVGFEDS